LRIDRCWLWLFAALLVALDSVALRAQTVAPPNAKGEKEPERAASRGQVVERAEPDIFYVRDENGELVPLLNYTLDDIKKLVELRDNSAAAPRATFRLERLVARAEAVGSYATVSLEISIVVSETGWVRVPLRLGNLVLTELPKTMGSGEQLVDFDPETREYVAWFRGKAAEPRQLSLRGLVTLDSDNGQTRFKLNAPRAALSELELTTRSTNAVGQVVSGGLLTDTQHTPSATLFRASGLANDFLMAWRDAETVRRSLATALSVEGEIVSTIDGGGVDTVAALKVSASGREFSGFQVRLPPGATLIPTDSAEYTTTEVAPPEKGGEQAERKLVEVRLKAKTTLPVNVKLTTRQQHDVTRESTSELGGFDCVGAVRQWGHLAVKVEDDWQVTFVRRQGVLQSDNLPAEMRSDTVVAGFLYFGQPFSLPVRVSPRQTRTAVEPRYVVRVSPHQLQLDGRLKYHITGAKIFSLSLDLNDWQLDLANLERAAHINSDALVFGTGNTVLIPLRQATTGEIEFKFRATKAIAANVTALDFRLPRLSADSSAATELAVLADDNVVLSPRAEELSGLSSWTPETDLELPAHRQAPWFYVSDLPDPHFAASFQVVSRRLAATVEANVTLSPSVTKVEEKLHYTVEHEAAESLVLLMPTSLAQAERVQVQWQDKRLTMEPVSSDQVADDENVAVRVHLPEPLLGPFQLDVAFEWTDEAVDGLAAQAATVKLDVPLVMPGEGFNRCEVNVGTDAPVEVSLVDKSWMQREPLGQAGEPALMLTATEPHTRISLGVSPSESALSDSLAVERAWIQTWLTDDQRIDRAVLRFRCRDGQFTLRMPPGSTAEVYRLDNNVVPAVSQGESPEERVLTLPQSEPVGGAHVLEISYELPQRPAAWGKRTLPLPSLLKATAVNPVYWQVLLPQNEFLLAGPRALAGDFRWMWQTVGWGRQPARGPEDLELWSGSSIREEPLPPSLNQYLFSGMTLPAQLEITTISRMELVLLASGMVLAAGLAWIYLPRIRRSEMLFVTGVALLAAAIQWPDLALLFVQAAVMGVLLVVLAAVLQRRMAQPQQRRVFRSGPSSVVGRSSTNTALRTLPPTPASTRSAAVAMELEAKAQP
jgi:hypothetical protein